MDRDLKQKNLRPVIGDADKKWEKHQTPKPSSLTVAFGINLDVRSFSTSNHHHWTVDRVTVHLIIVLHISFQYIFPYYLSS